MSTTDADDRNDRFTVTHEFDLPNGHHESYRFPGLTRTEFVNLARYFDAYNDIDPDARRQQPDGGTDTPTGRFAPCPVCECDPCDCDTLYTFPD